MEPPAKGEGDKVTEASTLSSPRSWVDVDDAVFSEDSPHWTVVDHDDTVSEEDADWRVVVEGLTSAANAGSWAMIDEKPIEGDENAGSEDGDVNQIDRLYEAEIASGVLSAEWKRALPHPLAESLVSATAAWRRWISSPFFARAHVAGIFFNVPDGQPSFSPFVTTTSEALPNEDLFFIPQPSRVLASTNGLVCLHSRVYLHSRVSNQYYVCNPFTKDWTVIPPPMNNHGDEPAVALVPEESATLNFGSDYQIVCAYQILDGVYGFERFESQRWGWRTSRTMAAVERIEPVSGVGAGGKAWWRTTMMTALRFDPEADLATEVAWPAGHKMETRWEIGEAKGKARCVCVASGKAEVFQIDGDRWEMVGKVATPPPPPPAVAAAEEEDEELWDGIWPLRGQGVGEVLTWENGTVMARDMASGSARILGKSSLKYLSGLVPYVSSLVPVKKGPEKPPNYQEQLETFGNLIEHLPPSIEIDFARGSGNTLNYGEHMEILGNLLEPLPTSVEIDFTRRGGESLSEDVKNQEGLENFTYSTPA